MSNAMNVFPPDKLDLGQLRTVLSQLPIGYSKAPITCNGKQAYGLEIKHTPRGLVLNFRFYELDGM